jgi:hypothetical protein
MLEGELYVPILKIATLAAFLLLTRLFNACLFLAAGFSDSPIQGHNIFNWISLSRRVPRQFFQTPGKELFRGA